MRRMQFVFALRCNLHDCDWVCVKVCERHFMHLVEKFQWVNKVRATSLAKIRFLPPIKLSLNLFRSLMHICYAYIAQKHGKSISMNFTHQIHVNFLRLHMYACLLAWSLTDCLFVCHCRCFTCWYWCCCSIVSSAASSSRARTALYYM